jgi:hypothetical protein
VKRGPVRTRGRGQRREPVERGEGLARARVLAGEVEQRAGMIPRRALPRLEAQQRERGLRGQDLVRIGVVRHGGAVRAGGARRVARGDDAPGRQQRAGVFLGRERGAVERDAQRDATKLAQRLRDPGCVLRLDALDLVALRRQHQQGRERVDVEALRRRLALIQLRVVALDAIARERGLYLGLRHHLGLELCAGLAPAGVEREQHGHAALTGVGQHGVERGLRGRGRRRGRGRGGRRGLGRWSGRGGGWRRCRHGQGRRRRSGRARNTPEDARDEQGGGPEAHAAP